MIKQFLFLLIGLFYSISAFPLDGGSLLKYCQTAIWIDDNQNRLTSVHNASDDLTASGLCYGYLYSATDFNSFTKYLMQDTKENSLVYCLSNGGIKYIQMARVVVKYLQNNPKDLNLPANILVMKAMHEAYPCPKEDLYTRSGGGQ